MNMYNALFGRNPLAGALLDVLGLTEADVGRFRDCFVRDGEIHVYTRNGGGNREEYQDMLDKLADHPQWIGDADDDFDRTYCTIRFLPPPGTEAFVEFLGSLATQKTPGEKWGDLFAALSTGEQTPAVARALDVGKRIFGPIIAKLTEQVAPADPHDPRD